MAARGLNKVMLIGHLGADPELRNTNDNTAVVSLRLATASSYKNRAGETIDATEWHRIVFFARQAEVLHDYTRKGSKLYIEGELRTRKWQDQSGQDRYTTEINGRTFVLLDSAGGKSASSPSLGGKSSGSTDDGLVADDNDKTIYDDLNQPVPF